MPYFNESDIPEPLCDGSLQELEWEGGWDDANRPREISCPICGVKLIPDFDQYAVGPKEGMFFGHVPGHYTGEGQS
jgi:hypothetical protein